MSLLGGGLRHQEPECENIDLKAQLDRSTPLVIAVVMVLGFVLLPVLLRLTGDAAWYTPAWLRKVLPDITFAHG